MESRQTTQMRKQAAYILRMVRNGKYLKPPTVNPNALDERGWFKFPLAPQTIDYRSQSRSSVYPLGQWARAEEHGVNPPLISLQGTFARQATYNPAKPDITLDGYQWQRALEDYINYYLHENYEAGVSRRPLITLEWCDTYRNEYWVVKPEGVPYSHQDSNAPMRESYDLRFTALTPISRTQIQADQLTQDLAAGEENLCAFFPDCKIKGNPFIAGCKYRGNS